MPLFLGSKRILFINVLDKTNGIMPYPAPAGFRWSFVVENNQEVIENGNRIVELQRID